MIVAVVECLLRLFFIAVISGKQSAGIALRYVYTNLSRFAYASFCPFGCQKSDLIDRSRLSH